MDAAQVRTQNNAKMVMILQLSIALIAALIFVVLESSWHGVSAVFGGIISISSSWLLRRGVLKASEIAKEDPKRGMTILYFGAVQRFVMIIVLFIVGLAALKLNPLATVLGFGSAQLAYAVVMRKTAYPAKR